jgi:FkbM family methyltransferase
MRLGKLIPLFKPLEKFCVEYADRFAGENNGDIKTNGELRFLTRAIPGCTVVFDVGANTGEWTALALSLKPSLTIHCFEPIKDMFTRLASNKFPPGVHCNNIGLSSEKSSRDMYLGVQSLYPRTGLNAGWGITSPGKPEKIECTTLDDYCAENGVTAIDLLKCDVEGHEHSVLAVGKKMLQAGAVKRIQFEYGGCYIDARVLLKDMFELLSGNNYSIYKIMPNRIINIPEYDQRLENFTYKNFAAIHRSVNL